MIAALPPRAFADDPSPNFDNRGKASGTVPSPDDHGGAPSLTICTAEQAGVDTVSFNLAEAEALAKQFNDKVQAGSGPPADVPGQATGWPGCLAAGRPARRRTARRRCR